MMQRVLDSMAETLGRGCVWLLVIGLGSGVWWYFTGQNLLDSAAVFAARCFGVAL